MLATGTWPMGRADRLGTDCQKVSAGYCVGLPDEMGLATDQEKCEWCGNLGIVTRLR